MTCKRYSDTCFKKSGCMLNCSEMTVVHPCPKLMWYDGLRDHLDLAVQNVAIMNILAVYFSRDTRMYLDYEYEHLHLRGKFWLS